MTSRLDYRVRFLAPDGSPMEEATLLAKPLPVAVDCAASVGVEIGAAAFSTSPKQEGRNSRPNAASQRKPIDYRQSGFRPAADAAAS